MITDYQQLHALQQGQVVQDSDGAVWVIKKFSYPPGTDEETWLCPFSDEYSFTVYLDGRTAVLGDTPTLPITVTSIESSKVG